MAFSLKIAPSSSVDMYGPPDQTSTYSISGHVAISLRACSSLLARQGPLRFQLQSLSLTFEGQSELMTFPTGYTAARLFSATEELVQQPFELFGDGDEDTEWNVAFDLRLPGWLPPTDTFGDSDRVAPGTRYILYATAKVFLPYGTNSWLSMCVPSCFRLKTIEAQPCAVIINRYANAPTLEGTWPMTCFGVTPLPRNQQPSKVQNATTIPIEIFEKLRVLVSVPQRISIDQSTFPLIIRVHAPCMPADVGARFRIPEFSVALDQCERYRSCLGTWAEHYPVPKPSCQPPHMPLRSHHPMRALYELGVCATPENVIVQDTFTLLRDSSKAKYSIDDPRPIFSNSQPDAWLTMSTSVQFTTNSIEKGRWVGAHTIRPSGSGPFLEVKHSLQVSLLCVIEGIDGAPDAREQLRFTLPVEFVRTRPTYPPPSTQSTEATVLAMPPLIPYDLPVYSHLYHSNGDRKIDHSEQLPVYSPALDETHPLLTDESEPKVSTTL